MVVESIVNTNPRTAQAYRELGFLADLIAEAQNLLRVIHAAKVNDCQIQAEIREVGDYFPDIGIVLLVFGTETAIEQIKVVLKDRQLNFDFGTIAIEYILCSPNTFTLD